MWIPIKVMVRALYGVCLVFSVPVEASLISGASMTMGNVTVANSDVFIQINQVSRLTNCKDSKFFYDNYYFIQTPNNKASSIIINSDFIKNMGRTMQASSVKKQNGEVVLE